MREVKVILSSPIKKYFGSELIKFWQKSNYSHVLFSWIDNQDRELVIHASHGNVHMMLMSNFLKENMIVESKSIQYSDTEYNILRDFCYDRLGTPYGTFDLLHIAIHDIFKNLGINIIPENDRGYICSELVSTGLLLSKNMDLIKPPHLMTPKDVKNLMENL